MEIGHGRAPERRMGVGESGRRYFEQHRLRPLQFRQDQSRLTGLRTMLLIYPSPKLAEMADPLAIFAERTEALSIEDMRAAVAECELARNNEPLVGVFRVQSRPL
jgi:hypothetical protein